MRAVTATWRQSTRIFTDFRFAPVPPCAEARIQKCAAPSCTNFIPLLVGPWLVHVSGSSDPTPIGACLPDVYLQLGQRIFPQTDSPQRALAGLLIGKAVCTADKATTLSWDPPLPLNRWALQAGHLQVATHRRQWLLFISVCGMHCHLAVFLQHLQFSVSGLPDWDWHPYSGNSTLANFGSQMLAQHAGK